MNDLNIIGQASDNTAREKHFKLIRFMIISATKLNVNDLGLATACTIYHKFFKICHAKDFDLYLVATSCIYLSIKIEEQEQIKLRDIINVCYRTRHPDLPHLELNEKYSALRNSVTQIELLIVRVLGFKLDFEHPHKYLLQYLDSLRYWIAPLEVKYTSPICEVAWQVLRDSLHTDMYSRYRPQEIAIAIIYLVCSCYGVTIPCNDSARVKWWQVLDERTDLGLINKIITDIMGTYEYETETIE